MWIVEYFDQDFHKNPLLKNNFPAVTSELLFCGEAFFSSSCRSFLLFLQEPSVLHFPLQLFFSPFARVFKRFRNLTFQVRKSAWMLPLRLFTTLQSPSPLVMIRLPLSIHSHLSTFLHTCMKKAGWILGNYWKHWSDSGLINCWATALKL